LKGPGGTKRRGDERAGVAALERMLARRGSLVRLGGEKVPKQIASEAALSLTSAGRIYEGERSGARPPGEGEAVWLP